VGESIGLADFIEQIKKELMRPEASVKDGRDPVKLLIVEEAELQIQLGVTREAQGGLNVQVIQLGAKGSSSDVHTVKVRLQPLLTHDERVALLKVDPRWPMYAQAALDHTVKSIMPGAGGED
jgi:hypothetical protein